MFWFGSGGVMPSDFFCFKNLTHMITKYSPLGMSFIHLSSYCFTKRKYIVDFHIHIEWSGILSFCIIKT